MNVMAERTHSCHFIGCSKTFKRKDHLRTHIERAHTVEKKYTCEKCLSKFATKDDLRHHLKSHSEVRNYGCDKCEAKFKTKKDLGRHLIIHTLDRPHICPWKDCDKCYKQIGHLTNHVKRVHDKQRDFKCENCPLSFSTNSELNGHSKKVHGVTRSNSITIASQPASISKHSTNCTPLSTNVIKKSTKPKRRKGSQNKELVCQFCFIEKTHNRNAIRCKYCATSHMYLKAHQLRLKK